MKKILIPMVRFVKSQLKKIYYACILSEREKRVQEWFKADGDNTLRVEYPLSSESVVFDVGGYKGDFASNIVSRYLCKVYIFEPVTEFYEKIKKRFEKNDKVLCYNFGFSNKDEKLKISVSDDSSSIYRGGVTQDITLQNISRFITDNRIDEIDLLKLNVEGSEYEIIKELISSGLIHKIVNLQVQFHEISKDSEKKMKKLQTKLSKTHYLTYEYKFVWENWRRKDGVSMGVDFGEKSGSNPVL